MYEHQNERMTLGTRDISVDESISDCQHSPYKTLRNIAIKGCMQSLRKGYSLCMHFVMIVVRGPPRHIEHITRA